jgi:hypothetical protein
MSSPSKKSMKKMGGKIKDMCAEALQKGTSVKETVRKLNPKIRGWANYFKAGNSAKKFMALDQYVYIKMGILWRRTHRRRIFTPETYRELGIYRASLGKVHA